MDKQTEVRASRKDWASDLEVKWCRGCGDFNVLNVMQKVLAQSGKQKHEVVFVSGIGCSSRLPYYLNTYGFHTIHGRAPSIASGVKLANPELDVWVITGDGDALSIGTNHYLHTLRRNHNIKILLFNNAVYGLTKGQASPTSNLGQQGPSTPQGVVDRPLNPLATALSSGASFVARTVDNDAKHLSDVLKRAAQHQGTAVVEILQNCVIFNDGVHNSYYGPKNRSKHLLYLKDNHPLSFDNDSYRLEPQAFGFSKIANYPDAESSPSMFNHNEQLGSEYAFALSQLIYPEFPVPVGILRCVSSPTFESIKTKQSPIPVAELAQKLNAELNADTVKRII